MEVIPTSGSGSIFLRSKEAASQAWSQGEGEKKEAAAAGIDETGELKLHMTPRQKARDDNDADNNSNNNNNNNHYCYYYYYYS